MHALTGADPFHPSGHRRDLDKAGSAVTVGIVPFVKAKRIDVCAICAVFKDAQPIVTPWPGKVDRSGINAFFVREDALAEGESFGLGKGMCRCCSIADMTGIVERADLTVFKQCFGASEDKIDRSFDLTVCINLPTALTLTQIIGQEAVIPLNKVIREGSGEQCVLCGYQPAVPHCEGVATGTCQPESRQYILQCRTG